MDEIKQPEMMLAQISVHGSNRGLNRDVRRPGASMSDLFTEHKTGAEARARIIRWPDTNQSDYQIPSGDPIRVRT